MMSHNKDGDEARKTFRPSGRKALLSEYEKEQEALRKNLERLRAERLARESGGLKSG